MANPPEPHAALCLVSRSSYTEVCVLFNLRVCFFEFNAVFSSNANVREMEILQSFLVGASVMMGVCLVYTS